jgi:acyl carrier protein
MIDQRLKALFADHLCIDDDATLTADKRLRDDLGADSLDQVELSMAVEEEFSIEVTDDEADACTTIGNWIDLVHQKTKGRQL